MLLAFVIDRQGVPQNLPGRQVAAEAAGSGKIQRSAINLGMLYETGQGVRKIMPRRSVVSSQRPGYRRRNSTWGFSTKPAGRAAGFFRGGQMVSGRAEQELGDAQCNLGLCYQTARVEKMRPPPSNGSSAPRARETKPPSTTGLALCSMEAAEAAATEAAKNLPR